MVQPEESLVQNASDPMQQLLGMIKDLTAEVAQLKQQCRQNEPTQNSKPKAPASCHVCKQIGHWKQNCPQLKAALELVKQGNEGRPQQ